MQGQEGQVERLPFSGQGVLHDHFLLARVREQSCWSAAGMAELHGRLAAACAEFALVRKPHDEENTRHEWLDKVLAILGWVYDREAKTRTGRPDYALFRTPGDRQEAVHALTSGLSGYYSRALGILEAKYWERPLDNVVRTDRFDTADASGQLVRYLIDLDVHTNGRLQWGILTNGRRWRLFWNRAQSRATSFYEVDLADLIENPHEAPGDYARLQYFVRFFEPAAFGPDPATGQNRLDGFVHLSDTYATRVTENLRARIFDAADGVFIRFARAANRTARDRGAEPTSEAELRELFDGTMTFLYRLLFLLYAESRDLLPARESGYGRYSLRRICADAAAIVDGTRSVAERSTDLWSDLLDLFRIVSLGSKNLNVPIYNGGLFAESPDDFFSRFTMYDADAAAALDALARQCDDSGRMATVDYRALGVRQLGSIYEGLLEFQLRVAGEPFVAIREKDREVWVPEAHRPSAAEVLGTAAAGELYMVTGRGERKTSGSYYTPECLVRYIVQHAVGPVLDERQQRVLPLLTECAAKQRRADDKRLSKGNARIAAQEAQAVEDRVFSALFDLRVLDPAMGSGHFLVETGDALADRLAAFLNGDTVKNALDGKPPEHERQPDESDPDNPLLELIARQRDAILSEMKRQGVTVDAAKLTDNNLIKRMVMKRCLFGVDLNPMAVELAKLSLWLHSFTLGAPLSFLDHHLRCGNSLLGIRDISQVIATGSNAFGQFVNFMGCLQRINGRADATLVEVQQDRNDFDVSQDIIEPYRRRFDFRLAASGFADMSGVNVGRLEIGYQNAALYPTDADAPPHGSGVAEAEAPLFAFMAESSSDGGSGGGGSGADADRAEPRRPRRASREKSAAEARVFADVRLAAARHCFFHWELEFPEAFYDQAGRRAEAGFDAVIGNPPWERMKLQEVEFFTLRAPAIAFAPTAAKRRALIADLATADPGLAEEYAVALRTSQDAMDWVRRRGEYPLLGHGDMNLYSLFVERAVTLTAPGGRTGLVTPSGLATDSGSQQFFRVVTESGRLAEFIDFENRKVFFPEVDSRFKFAVSIILGEKLPPSETRCAFFVHQMEEIEDPERAFVLAPADFALLNPNTRTCPVFRCRRDAELTKAIYRRVPILWNEADPQTGNPWGIRFSTMFHMTNDSGLFRTAKELDAAGFWLGTDMAWHKGKECYVRLYEGKMVQMFDHRAARIVVDPRNLFRPAYPEPVAPAEHADPKFLIKPQFWVAREAVAGRLACETPWQLGFKEITSPTNERTFILAALPPEGFGNKVPLIGLPNADMRREAPALMANLSSFAFDFTVRQKIGGQTLNFFIVKQLPVLPPSAYAAPFKGHDLRPWLRDRVLELTYTAEDMAGFAQDLGYDAPPFGWDEERRLHLRCQLDALFFHLYGVDRADAGYILDTFPIVRDNDLAAYGRYRTKELILAYWNAFAAGDLNAWISA